MGGKPAIIEKGLDEIIHCACFHNKGIHSVDHMKNDKTSCVENDRKVQTLSSFWGLGYSQSQRQQYESLLGETLLFPYLSYHGQRGVQITSV